MSWDRIHCPLLIQGAVLILGLVAKGETSHAADWPHFRGPDHNGISGETTWRTNWDELPPEPLWRAEVGIGFSAVSVAGGKVLTVGHQSGSDVFTCLDEQSGRTVWNYRYPSELGAMFYIGGPGSTPSIDVQQNRVYGLGKWGEVFCFDLASGKVIWQRHLATEEGIVVPDWGLNGSPLISGDTVVLNAGRSGFALDRRSGTTVWRSEGTECGYSTPLPFQQGEESMLIVSSGEGYLGVGRENGQVRWEIPWLTRYGVNAADPIVWRGNVFVSSGYNKGSGLYDLESGRPELVWRQRRFRAQQNAPVRVGAFLYGFDGDSASRAKLKCLRWEDGTIAWEDETFGYGALSVANGFLILIGSDGRLGLAKANSERFQPVVVSSVLESDCWTVPVLANGRILCRNSRGSLVSLDVLESN